MNQQKQKNIIESNIYRDYLSLLLLGARMDCNILINKILKKNSNQDEIHHNIINIYENLFQKSLYEIGELWEKNLITVTSEHMATALVEGNMNELYPLIVNPKRINKKVIVSSVEKEEHQVGAKMVADVFEMNGWDALYLGANTPLKDLIIFIKNFRPNILALSLSVYFNLPNLETMLSNINNTYPDIQIIIGGQAFRHGGNEIACSYSNVRYIPSLYELEKFIY
ncbi:MAG: cobalamin-dependent protein [Desulfobacterales bacterium]|nr:cobalamin-dependent protein [Desulfobacterales bacterium]